MKDLKNIIICPHCEAINKKRDISENEIALCHKCGSILYRRFKYLELKFFLLSFSAFIFFVIAMFYPIIKINIIGYQESLEIVRATIFLFKNGYIFISFFVFMSVFLFPMLCIVLTFMVSFLLLTKYNKKLIKNILIFLTILKDWCFIDIFFIAILVSLIKVFSYASIEFNIGFLSYIIFLGLIFYLFKIIGVKYLWEIYENI